ncbi:aminoglycoside phosphotransferase [Corynebacterium suranareeae]|uniref:Aminoglycoside phosphotransferase n=1 Tax=Corynebacterium suranareeae TaxID=2506452 RepID=A0A160PU66_9CORY|nr:phosphotransferase [Corynebacterium suranareeae]BAU96631.1 aminoglycoside phosphotransferase [Corynebacterium suranareeae]
MSIGQHIINERFYGAKSQTIHDVDIVLSQECGENTLAVVRINNVLYQLLVNDDGKDVLDHHVEEVGASFGTWAGDADFPIGPFKELGAQQSNSSFITADKQAIVKYFRKLEPGLNPDVELLSQISSCTNIAPILGFSTATIDGRSYTLVMAQQYIPGQDAWEYALTTTNASFADDAEKIGQATRNVHTALAQAFPTSVVSAQTLGDGLTTRLDSLIHQAPELAKFKAPARSLYQSLEGDAHIQRIHGDLHLGQLIKTSDRYILIDFEGEPARPLHQRRLPDSPLRDLAGIIRSIDYAANFDGEFTQWANEATALFLAGYGSIENEELLNAYILDKALYEVAYEINNRPDWVKIPLEAVERILD